MNPRIFTEKTSYLEESVMLRTREDFDKGSEIPDGRHIRLSQENRPGCACGLAWEFCDLSPDAYVFLPAGAYNGNRQPSLPVPYSPRVPEGLVQGLWTPPYITDVPRLAEGSAPSRLQLKSGDLAFPAFGLFDPQKHLAWLVIAPFPADAADWIFEVVQEEPGHAVFRISSPGVRQSPIYRMPFLNAPSPDRAAGAAGATNLVVRCHQWTCRTLPEFFDRIFSLRADLAEASPHRPPDLPFSAAVALIEAHYLDECWRDDLGLFVTECAPGAPLPFQTGWCGGMMATYPLLASTNPRCRELALRSLDTFFQNAPLPGGLFHGRCTADGKWTGDFAHDAARPYTHRWTLVRRQADALYFLLAQIRLHERLAPGWMCPPAWESALRACAGAFVRLWESFREFGQFVDVDGDRIHVGGSASGGLVPAALVAAWQRFGDRNFLETACDAGHHFAAGALARGLTTGGPGDALQCPDSESVAALVESYAALHAATGEAIWLEHGCAAAAQLATWVMPFHFPFPAGSEFHRLGIGSRGSVFANVQNKHAAPGLCTHSGAGLWWLFRATGDLRLMDLLCDIARFIPHAVSREDRPIRARDGTPLPPGWINERVNTGDWDDNPGGVFQGSCWCEVSLMLSALELPGIYVRPDLDRVWCLDHVEAEIRSDRLAITNPTAFPARVRLCLETAGQAGKALDDCWFAGCQMVEMPPGGSCEVPLTAGAGRRSALQP